MLKKKHVETKENLYTKTYQHGTQNKSNLEIRVDAPACDRTF